MSLFKNEDVSALNNRIESLMLEISALKEENQDYQDTIASFHLNTSKYDNEIENLKKQHAEEIKALNNKLVETENSVNKRLNQTLQSVGVSKFLVDIPIEVKSNKEVYNKYLSMPPGSEKTKFYQENEAAIRQGLGLA